MSDSDQWDRLLRQALAPAEEPDEKLNQHIIQQWRERSRMKRVNKKRISAGALAAVIALALSVTAYAAAQLFSSRQVAEHLGEKAIAEAFESKDAIEMNRTVDSGDYRITLHGIVSGVGLRGFEGLESSESSGSSEGSESSESSESSGSSGSSVPAIKPDKTYAVVSISRQDGAPMPHTSDPSYGEVPFFVSPLIKGLKPWQVNIASMGGGYSEFVLDGVMYRLIECDGVEMFADRGVYLAISSGSSFYSNDAFAYDESTGEVSPKTGYEGAAVLFVLPLDPGKADRAKADAYLEQLLKEPSADNGAGQAEARSEEEARLVKEIEELKSKLSSGTVIPESVKEVSYDNKGNIVYEHDGWRVMLPPGELFAEGQTGYSEAAGFSGDGERMMALQFHKDEQGVITGRILILK